MSGSRALACHLVALLAVASGLVSDLDFVFPTEAPAGVEVQPHDSILLTEGTLHTIGEAQEASAALTNSSFGGAVQAAGLSSGALQKVCERTEAVLFSQTPGKRFDGRLPGAPVYRECMAALSPLRNEGEASNAIDSLSDCMALVNALVKHSQSGAVADGATGSPCRDISSVLEARPATKTPAAASATTAATAARAEPEATQAAQTAQAMDLVAEAMTDVCSQTVHRVEANIKLKEDAMKLGNAVSPVCEENARQHLKGASGASSQLLREWCNQLDGRLTLALQTGFFFALEPEEAERLAREANPYATTTRRLFCGRFIESLRHQAEAGGLYLGGPAPVSSSKETPVLAPRTPKPEPTKQTDKLSSTAVPPVSSVPKAVGPSQPSVAVSGTKISRTPVDMLNLVQALSHHDEWTTACNTLISRLSSEEGSVLEEFALGDDETPDGTKVLTFNSNDQAELRKCSAQMKVLAVRIGAVVADASTGAVSLLETQESSSTGASLLSESADAMEALVDSPWSYDACADLAHSFLTAHLAHPDLRTADFCPLYAHGLREMHGRPQETSADAASKDLQKMRFMAAKRRPLSRRSEARVSSTTLLPSVAARVDEAKRPNSAFLIKTAAVVKSVVPAQETDSRSAQDGAGLDFWNGMLQD